MQAFLDVALANRSASKKDRRSNPCSTAINLRGGGLTHSTLASTAANAPNSAQQNDGGDAGSVCTTVYVVFMYAWCSCYLCCVDG